MGKPITYTDGVVYGIVQDVDSPDAPLLRQRSETQAAEYGISTSNFDSRILQVTNNNCVWSYALRPTLVPIERAGPVGLVKHLRRVGVYDYMPKGLQFTRHRGRDSLTADYREPLQWALRDIARRSKLPATDPDALQESIAYERTAEKEAGISEKGPFGPIRYTGYDHMPSHFPLDRLHGIMEEAVVECASKWNWRSEGSPPWKPTGLEVMRHSGNNALGLAYAPGSGKDANRRVVSLHSVLFQKYDNLAIWRVIVHELCHHYREEVFARRDFDEDTANKIRLAVTSYTQSGGRLPKDVLNTHDSIFVRELGRVDAKVAIAPVAGLVFTEYADPSLVAEIEKKKAVRAATVRWDPARGRIFINRKVSDGKFSVFWMPLAKGEWRPVRFGLGRTQYADLVNKLGGHEASARVPMTYSETWPSRYTKPQTLGEFTAWLHQVYPGYFH